MSQRPPVATPASSMLPAPVEVQRPSKQLPLLVRRTASVISRASSSTAPSRLAYSCGLAHTARSRSMQRRASHLAGRLHAPRA